MSIAESLAAFSSFMSEAKTKEIRVRGYVSCAIACPYEGLILPSKVHEVALRLLDMGCDEIALGDTIGTGTPRQVQDLLAHNPIPLPKLAFHFHDTYGQAIANIYAALEGGVAIFDSSISGLGGCPYAKGATGNVATEDVLYLLQGLEIETGIDWDKLLQAGEFIDTQLQRQTTSKVTQALFSEPIY